jgi:hypothetical protein
MSGTAAYERSVGMKGLFSGWSSVGAEMTHGTGLFIRGEGGNGNKLGPLPGSFDRIPVRI